MNISLKKDDLSQWLVAGVGVASLGLMASSAMAISAPEAGTFGYTIYDVGVNDILNGGPGFVGGLMGVVWSAVNIAKNWMLATLGILGSTAVLQADAITTSLGMIV